MRNTIIGVLAFALVGTMGAMASTAYAMDEPGQSEEMAADKAADASAGECCEKGDTTPPLELIAKTKPGEGCVLEQIRLDDLAVLVLVSPGAHNCNH